MKYLSLALATALGVSISSAPAFAVTTPSRHVVFNVTTSLRSQTDILTDLGTGATGTETTGERPDASSGSNVAHQIAGSTARGTITLDIVAVDADHTIVADVSENTDTRKQPVVRVIILPTGIVQIAPGDVQNITAEEQVLLRLLGRDVLSPATVARGTWKLSTALPHGNTAEEFHVISASPDGDVKFTLDANTVVKDVVPYDQVTHGTIIYNLTKSLPKSIELHMRTHQEGIQKTDTLDQGVSLQLAADSGT
jgi:hypothetical protein